MFTDRRTLDRLEHRMRRDGTLASSWMATTFDLLRANDLIFNYLVSGWLMGDDPPAFDVLAWNADSTRMPAAMHAFYLRHFYLENRLASGTLKMAGRTIDLGAITTPTYLVSAVNDHIVPWEAAYRGGHLLGGPVRFVLTSGGHIAGVVSPAAVGPTRSWYRASARDTVLPSSGALWRDGSVHRVGSWWEDWARWSRGSAGPLRNPPSIGSQRYPTLGEGPGDYVLG
jgi:polyhydroxyalkanoate synthase